MDKILYIVITAAVLMMVAITVLTATSSNLLSTKDTADETGESIACSSAADNYEEGDFIRDECVSYLPEDERAQAQNEILADEYSDEIR